MAPPLRTKSDSEKILAARRKHYAANLEEERKKNRERAHFTTERLSLLDTANKSLQRNVKSERSGIEKHKPGTEKLTEFNYVSKPGKIGTG
ncbi:hypothetical protein CVT26_002516 [Gymnopilus dilepis]|uniref:Uncharacterized protein n=1 Tax=Gymnopilus dilepis TaxID=231916 RepID=A0A409YN95_9AGAR|nr:hypothetical protein CVT26_002516 [Gymnopilus dilepis]